LEIRSAERKSELDNQEIRESFRALRNRVKQITRNKYEKWKAEVCLQGSNNEGLWKTMKDAGIIKNKAFNVDSELAVDINKLNSFFTMGTCIELPNKFKQLYTKRDREVQTLFDIGDILEEDIIGAVSHIKSKAVGPDGLSICLYKVLLDEIMHVLLHLFNAVVAQGKYPSKWKYSTVIPIPKCKTPRNEGDYRAISILCALAKVFDRIVFLKLNSFINTHKLIDPMQCGYKANNSTETALTKLTEDIRVAIDNRQLTVLVLIDFKRAFDSVQHKTLLAVLESLNVSPATVRFIHSYISQRFQRIKGRNELFSEWKETVMGIPQGSVLSALIFSIYLNEIGSNLESCKYLLYADDLQIYLHTSVIDINISIDKVNKDLETLGEWCAGHGLEINPIKCNAILIGHGRLLNKLDDMIVSPVKVNNKVIPWLPSVKSLGILISRTLGWDEQVRAVCRKVYAALQTFKHLTFHPNIEVKKKLVQAVIIPVLDYASVAFCDLPLCLINTLQKAFNSAVRYIFNLPWDAHVTPYYRSLGWLKIKEKIELRVGMLAYKIVKTGEPPYLKDFIRKFEMVGERITRSTQKKFLLPKNRTTTLNKGFSCQAANLLNSWYAETNEGRISLKSFNKLLKENLLQKYYQ